MSEAATPLPPQSEEFGAVEYQLKLSLRSSDITDLQIWSVANPHTTVPYDRKTRGKLRLDSWVNVNTLSDRNDLDSVCRKGFSMPATGCTFDTGNILLEGQNAGSHKMLLCEIGVGRSYVVDNNEDSHDLPVGYDSLYIAPKIDRDGDGVISTEEYAVTAALAGRPAEAYHHRYVILDSAQVLPKYIVSFTFNPASSSPAVLCDMCESEEAELHCARCPGNLCPACDQEVHGANKLVARHKRVAMGSMTASGSVRARLDALKTRLGDGFAIQSVCPNHKHTQVSYFCKTCFIPVCVDCKMVGTHSSGEYAHHPLTPIVVAYEEALASSSATDPMVEARKIAINGRLEALAERLKAVTDNAASVEEEIYAKLQEALHQLREERHRKVSVLLGEEIELRRQLEQLEWTASFLVNQQDALAPAAFLDAWARHSKLTEHMQLQAAELADTSLLETVKPDIKMFGHVVVMSDSEAAEKARHLGAATAAPTPDRLAAPAIIAGIKNYVRATDAPASLGVGFAPNVSGGGSLATAAPGHRRGGPRGVGSSQGGSNGSSSSLADSMWRSVLKEGMQGERGAVGAARPRHNTAVPSPRYGRGGNSSRAGAGMRSPPPLPPAAKSAVAKSIADRAAHYRLSKAAARNLRDREDLGAPAAVDIFPGSKILKGNNATTLYNVLPLTEIQEEENGVLENFAVYPHCTLLWANYNAYPAKGNIKDFVEQSKLSADLGSTVVVVRAGDQIFGGFASAEWDFSGGYCGNSGSFLFSVTKNCKIPYTGRIQASQPSGDAGSGRGGVEESKSSMPKGADSMNAGPDFLQFGLRDLIIKGDLSDCQSELEYSFGIGLPPGSVEAKTMLAGKPRFVADEVEIWGVSDPAEE